ncbi:MAG: PAS domain-containing protein, partial [Alphaproteobacteria bacterium]
MIPEAPVEGLFSVILDTLPYPVFVKHPRGQILYANKMFRSIGPFDPVGKTNRDFVPPEMAEVQDTAEQWVRDTGEVFIHDLAVGDRIIMTCKRPLRNSDGSFFALLCCSLDTT